MFNLTTINFEISERKILLRVFDVFFVLFFLYLFNFYFEFHYIAINNLKWSLVLMMYLLFFGTIFEMYNLQVASNQYSIVKSVILTTVFTHIFFLLTPILTPSLPKNRLEILLFFLIIFFALFIWRFLYLKVFASNHFNKNILLIANVDHYENLLEDLYHSDPHFKITAFCNTNKSSFFDTSEIVAVKVEDLKNIVFQNKISEIIVDNIYKNNISIEIYNNLLYFIENGVSVKEYTQVYEDITHKIPKEYLAKDIYNFFPFNRNNNNRLYKIFTRLFDIFFSLIVLSFFILIFPIIISGNLLANKGNLFYTQERVGKNNEVFKIVKLRSMIKNAEVDGATFALKNDSRVTFFGKFLRKTRIDEIPQIFNILKGEMSVIGPRPERPFFVEQISKNIPFYNTRHIIKPGITGWAQVNYSYTDNIDEALIKLQYDMYYIKKRNFFLDVNIIIKTLSTVFFLKGQ